MKLLLNKYRDIIIYLIFGVLTTVVNYIVYFALFNYLSFSAAVSNIIAWVFAVLFAFATNKPFVFNSRDWSREVVLPEFVKFIGCRFGSGLAETVLLYVFVDWLNFNGNIWKLLLSIMVVVLNYVFSKFIVFKGK